MGGRGRFQGGGDRGGTPHTCVIAAEDAGDRIRVVHVHGPLDGRGAESIDEVIAATLAEGAADIVLELSGVAWITSAGAAACVVAAGRAQACGGLCVVSGAPRAVARSLDTLGVFLVCLAAEDRSAALALVRRARAAQAGLRRVRRYGAPTERT